MSVSLEETIAKLDEAKKRGLLGIYGIKISRILKLLRELQERRKADNEIPFGNASFSELDSIINAYEIHGNHKKVVELLKELQERRKLPEIIHCGECVNFVERDFCKVAGHNVHRKSNCMKVFGAERRTDG